MVQKTDKKSRIHTPPGATLVILAAHITASIFKASHSLTSIHGLG